MPKINVKNAINPKINNIVRFILGLIIIRYVILRTIFSWNNEAPSLFYFTILSNIYLAIFWILSPWLKENLRARISFFTTVYMTITGLIFIILLDVEFTKKLYDMLSRNEIDGWIHYYSMISSIFTHYIMPLLALLDYLFFTDIQKVKISKLKYVFAFPIMYLIFHVIYTFFTGKYIYPFMSPEYMGSMLNVIAICVLIILFIMVLVYALYYLNRFIQKRCEKYYKDLIKSSFTEGEGV